MVQPVQALNVRLDCKKSLIFLYRSTLSSLSNLKIKVVGKKPSLPVLRSGSSPRSTHYKICQNGRTSWPRWTQAIMKGISRVQTGSGAWTGPGLRSSAALSAEGI